MPRHCAASTTSSAKRTGKVSWAHVEDTGFPKIDARFSKLKSIPDLLSDEKEGKIVENFSYLSNRATFMGNPVDE